MQHHQSTHAHPSPPQVPSQNACHGDDTPTATVILVPAPIPSPKSEDEDNAYSRTPKQLIPDDGKFNILYKFKIKFNLFQMLKSTALLIVRGCSALSNVSSDKCSIPSDMALSSPYIPPHCC